VPPGRHPCITHASNRPAGWSRRVLVPGLIVVLVAGSTLSRPALALAEHASVLRASVSEWVSPQFDPSSTAASASAAILGVVTSSDAPLIDGGDGRIFFPGDRRGTVRLDAVAPAELQPMFSATPVAGWQVHQPAAGSGDRTLELSFVPGAAALSVTVEFRDVADALVATIDRTLTAGQPDRHAAGTKATASALAISVPVDAPEIQPIPLASLPRDPEYLAGRYPPSAEVVDAADAPSSVVTLEWVEQRFGTPILERRLRIESAPVDPAAGCRSWKTIDERGIELASGLAAQPLADGQSSTNAATEIPAAGSSVDVTAGLGVTAGLAMTAGRGVGANVASAAVRPPSWPASLVAPDDSTAQRGDFARFPWEFELQRPAWRVGRLAIPLGGEGCLRFSLVVRDSLKGNASLVWPVVAPGRLAFGGRVLPVYEGRLDLFRRAAFASQQHYTWCIGTTGQMMVSLITGQRSDPRSQPYFMAWAATHDWVDHSRWGGSDDEGLRSLLERFSGVRYEKVWVSDTAAALRLAALRMRLTGAPAEITVMDGKHAWVLHGFDSATDPLLDGQALIRAVYVSGPLWPRAPQSGGFDPAADTRMSPAALYHYLSPAGGHGPWKVVVPVPGPRGRAASQPSSLAEIGLWWWPKNMFSELRALPDLRTADVSPITSTDPSSVATASPAAIVGATPDPTAVPTPDPTALPTPDPTAVPTPDPTAVPTPDPTAVATPDPTPQPTPDPTAAPTP
jgi:hypothetical protein